MELKKLDHHRNGVSGLGFYVAIVKHEGKDMLVVRFPKSADREVGAVLCAAFDIELLAKQKIEFGVNSFRGDHYSGPLDEMIAKHEMETFGEVSENSK